MTKCRCILFVRISLYASLFSISEFTSYSLWCSVSTIAPDASVIIVRKEADLYSAYCQYLDH